MEGGRGGGKLLLQGLRHSVLNARERMQQEGRNFKSSSRILQRVGDLRYARCYVRKQEIQSRFPDSPLASSRNCHAFKYRLIQISRNRWNSFFFPTRVILYYCLRIVIHVFLFYFMLFYIIFHSLPFFSSRKILIFPFNLLLRFVFVAFSMKISAILDERVISKIRLIRSIENFGDIR